MYDMPLAIYHRQAATLSPEVTLHMYSFRFTITTVQCSLPKFLTFFSNFNFGLSRFSDSKIKFMAL